MWHDIEIKSDYLNSGVLVKNVMTLLLNNDETPLFWGN